MGRREALAKRIADMEARLRFRVIAGTRWKRADADRWVEPEKKRA